MSRTQGIEGAVCAGALVILIAVAGCADTATRGHADRDRIVAPSQYVEDIETEGSVGGVEDEADAADAQAEAAEAAAKKAAEKAKKKKKSRPTEGGW
jgi:hypothetical protein